MTDARTTGMTASQHAAAGLAARQDVGTPWTWVLAILPAAGLLLCLVVIVMQQSAITFLELGFIAVVTELACLAAAVQDARALEARALDRATVDIRWGLLPIVYLVRRTRLYNDLLAPWSQAVLHVVATPIAFVFALTSANVVLAMSGA